MSDFVRSTVKHQAVTGQQSIVNDPPNLDKRPPAQIKSQPAVLLLFSAI
jgi:hypothetical protein